MSNLINNFVLLNDNTIVKIIETYIDNSTKYIGLMKDGNLYHFSAKNIKKILSIVPQQEEFEKYDL